MSLRSNLEAIQAAVCQASLACGRNPAAIKILAVSKRVPASSLAAAQECGQLLFGENYLQEAAEKIPQLSGPLEWHFIGHLQSNKAAQAVKLFQVIQTVDRLKIAHTLNKHAGLLGKQLEVLIQVNVGLEDQKSGVQPQALGQLLQDVQALPHLRILGLMTMPPYNEDPEASRPWFRQLRKLSEQFSGVFANPQQIELSMGLSGDFSVAIQEGATLVRIGTAIFGERTA
jgi:pyridoxal phosphate enzyme (YggS family)